ncbi:hypothetical protein COCSADRAFT_61253, partial [Bipolaris sorokiniana ND90Pr]
VKNYVAVIAEWEPSNSWVTRFLKRHNDVICIRKATGIDRDRHRADNPANYQSYFDLIYAKLNQYSIAPHNIYNMDEKGFLLGRIMPSKRIFSKELWEQKKIRKTLQDGSRDWITIVGCICADGSSVDPTIIYEGTDGLRNEWLRDLEAGKHQVFCCNSPSGWSNNDLALAWVEQVFDRLTKEKAKRDYRLLLLDRHGSHLAPAFIDYCDAHRLLLAVIPPHCSHRLQPLDVALFKPLSRREYGVELDELLRCNQSLGNLRKNDFLRLSCAAFTSAFTPNNILSSFAATGVHPRDADAMSKLLDAAVPDTSSVAAKRVSQALHSLHVNNKLLHVEYDQLRDEL